MIYGSVCSGIEAATVAWHPLGWHAAWFSEIEEFPKSVLAHHYPDTPDLGDMTTICDRKNLPSIDLLVGGTPCQSFSVAGERAGLDDARGNLALEFCKIARTLKPRWIVWENVPGILSSNGGKDFGTILGEMAECGYGIAYRVLDAQYFGVPQRRRRVYTIGYLGDWRKPFSALFEQGSLCGNSTTGEKYEQIVPGVAHEDTDETEGLGFVDAYNQSVASIAPTLSLPNHNSSFVVDSGGIRRYHPAECERLMGFPVGYTNITGASRNNRHAALGNSMAVPVMRWIGERIEAVERHGVAWES
jgi:DNA (cytosine-5)-methyltransferase 1